MYGLDQTIVRPVWIWEIIKYPQPPSSGRGLFLIFIEKIKSVIRFVNKYLFY